MYDIKTVGCRIREFRHKQNLTQTELAERLGLSYQAVSSWETGASSPDIENLCKLAMVFHTTVDCLLKRDAPQAMIAVDGGGTKSEFALFYPSGKVIKRFVLGGTNTGVYGLETVMDTLCQGINRCIGEMVNIRDVYIGTAGGNLEEIRNRLSVQYPKFRITVESDGLNALFSKPSDAALICKTGSLLILKEGDEIRRIGGRGYMLGDPGSAYNFGLAVLRFAADYEDGVYPHSRFYREVCRTFHCTSLREAIKSAEKVPFIASLAPLFFEAYRDGDADAATTLHSEMKTLANLLNASCKPHTRVNLCGTMFEQYGDILLPILRRYIQPEITFSCPALPPIFGACVRCCILAGAQIGPDFESNFSAQ